MSRPMPPVPGVRHADHALPTGVRLHVAEAGDPAAPAMLAVHGWPQHWWMWRGAIPALAATHRVICPDLRRFGWSGQPADGDFAKDRFADDMLALLDVLGMEGAGYLGHDWGGWTGWLLAIRASELPALAAGRLAGARIDLPVKLLFGRREGPQSAAQLDGVERHVPRGEVELVDGGHWLPDERPQLVADRAVAWFA